MKLRQFTSLFALFFCMSVGLLQIQPALAQDYTCPDETGYFSETPFTLEEIEEIFGFRDPSLQEVADLPPDPFTTIGNIYFFNLTCTYYNQLVYVGIVHLAEDQELDFQIHVYELENNQIIKSISTRISTVWTPWSVQIHGFADRNFNGLPDFFLTGSNGGNSPNGGMRFLELAANDEIIQVTNVGDIAGASGFDDINGDGIPEIYGFDTYFVPTAPFAMVARQRLDIWWEWTGIDYQVVAVQVEGFPTNPTNSPSLNTPDSGQRILNYVGNLQSDEICSDIEQSETSNSLSDVSWRIFHILMYYYSWNNLEEGWTQIANIENMVSMCANSHGKERFFSELDVYETYFQEDQD